MKKHRSLMVQLSLAIVVITTAVLAVFGYYKYLQNSRVLRAQLEQSLSLTVERLAVALSSPYFNYYDAGIKDIILSEMKRDAVIGIYIFAFEEEILHYGYFRLEDNLRMTKEMIVPKGTVGNSHKITYNKEVLGEVHVVMTTRYMKERLLKAFISDIVQIVMLDICLVVLVMFLLKTKFVRPITRLTTVSSEIAAGKLDQPIEVRSNDEIGVLARSFAHMRNSIREKMADLADKNEELQQEIADRKHAEETLRESEERYRSLFDGVPVGLYRTTSKGQILDANLALVQMLNVSDREDLLAANAADFYVNSETRRQWQALLAREGVVRDFEVQFRQRDGTIIWVRNSCRTARDDEGEVLYYEGSLEDITKRKRAEEALKLLKRSIETIQVGVTITDIESKILYTNPAEAAMHGYNVDDLVGHDVRIFAPDETWKKIPLEKIKKIENWKRESINIRKDGSTFPVQLTSTTVKDSQGEVIGIVTVCEDITERKRAENLIHTQRDLGLALSAATGLDEGLHICVEAALHVSGMDCGGVYLVDETSGTLDLIFHTGLPPDFVKSASHYDADSANMRLIMAGEPIYTRHQEAGIPLDEVRRKEQLCAIAIIPLHHEDHVIGCLNIASHTAGEIPAFSRIALETIAGQIGSAIARLKAEEALRESEERYRQAVENSPNPIFSTNKAGIIQTWNRACQDVFQYESDIIGQPYQTLLRSAEDQPAIEAMLAQVFQNHSLSNVDIAYRGKDGVVRFMVSRLYPLLDYEGSIQGCVFANTDITERKRMEEIMIQTEKMMSVGGLAAGMAHEINNPLSGMLQSAQNILRRTSPQLPQNVLTAQECGTDLETIRSYLGKRGIFGFIESIRESGERAAQIVANMLSFSRRSESEKIPVSLSALIDRTMELASTDYDLKKQYDFRHIRIEREYDPGLPEVPCVETEISQVLLNLLRNAAQAMAGRGERAEAPRIILRTYRESDMARIEVEDNGPGMDETVRKRLFEPFFTTKDVGGGTGLGLSVSYFIITNNHQGTIRVESTEDQGTKFIIHLPLEGRIP